MRAAASRSPVDCRTCCAQVCMKVATRWCDQRQPSQSRDSSNDFGKRGYGGPCPPKGHGPHHYHFKLFALDTDKLEIPDGAKVVDVENAARKQAIAEGELVGTYERR